MKLGELWFDTYESRKSVRTEYIDKLERLYLWEDLELISRNLKALIRQHSV